MPPTPSCRSTMVPLDPNSSRVSHFSSSLPRGRGGRERETTPPRLSMDAVPRCCQKGPPCPDLVSRNGKGACLVVREKDDKVTPKRLSRRLLKCGLNFRTVAETVATAAEFPSSRSAHLVPSERLQKECSVFERSLARMQPRFWKWGAPHPGGPFGPRSQLRPPPLPSPNHPGLCQL